MDERNERLIMSRIVANTASKVQPQYFLITPKLLHALTCMEADHVTLHFVFNGPAVLKQAAWNVNRFLERDEFAGVEERQRAASSSSSSNKRRAAAITVDNEEEEEKGKEMEQEEEGGGGGAGGEDNEEEEVERPQTKQRKRHRAVEL